MGSADSPLDPHWTSWIAPAKTEATCQQQIEGRYGCALARDFEKTFWFWDEEDCECYKGTGQYLFRYFYFYLLFIIIIIIIIIIIYLFFFFFFFFFFGVCLGFPFLTCCSLQLDSWSLGRRKGTLPVMG